MGKNHRKAAKRPVLKPVKAALPTHAAAQAAAAPAPPLASTGNSANGAASAAQAAQMAAGAAAAAGNLSPLFSYLNPGGANLDIASLLSASGVSMNDPHLPAAWQQWASQALGRMDSIPKFTQSQLSALAGAAAGVTNGNINLNINAALGNVPLPPGVMMPGSAAPGSGGQAGAVGTAGVAGGGVQPGSNPMNIDLPSSLAALFEAKMTLDREKAKLMRMQKELKGYREGVAMVNGPGFGGGAAAAATGHGGGASGHHHAGEPARIGNGKGKEVAIDDLGECTCGRHGHEDPVDDYYESDGECSYDCDCDCHSYYECDHAEGEPCEHDHDHEHDDHSHDNHHQPHHQHQHPEDEYEYEDEGSQGRSQQQPQQQHHQHHQHHHSHPHPHAQQPTAAGAPPPGQNGLPQPQRNPAQQRGVDEHSRQWMAANGYSYQQVQRKMLSVEGSRITDDPQRLDEAVKVLFDWIKGLVWSIQRAAQLASANAAAIQARK